MDQQINFCRQIIIVENSHFYVSKEKKSSIATKKGPFRKENDICISLGEDNICTAKKDTIILLILYYIRK